MDTNDGRAAQQARFYRYLAFALVVGILVALALAWADVINLGWFSQDQAFNATGFTMIVVVVIVLLFLLKIGSIFVELKAAREDAREMMKTLDQHSRDAVEKMMQELRGRSKDITADVERRLGEESGNIARLAERMTTEMGRNNATLERLNNRIESLDSRMGGLLDREKAWTAAEARRTKRDEEWTIQYKSLQEFDASLRRDLNALTNKVTTVLEAQERREMEEAAQKQGLTHQLADVKRREGLMLIKQKELEDALAAAADKPVVKLTERDEREHVLTIEGIGTKYAARLNQIGIISIPQLMKADAEAVAGQIDAMPGLVEEWQAMARLIQVRGVGPQFAEVLVKAGVTTVEDLGSQDAHRLSTKIIALEKDRKVRIQGATISDAVVQRWIDAAQRRDFA
jgi:predicted flap endonuclease-1-like 5' DNA nuclease